MPNTEYVFLDQPAAGLKNRITDKVKVGTQILPSGSNQVLSQYRSIEQQLPLSQSFTPDVNSIEVAFSPQNEINDDIIEQIGYFNLGEKIGDNRYNFYTRSTNPNFYEFTKNENVPYRTDYQDLTQFSREYFEKYTSNYNAFDYIRLIRFFDNSLFKMIKDFVPAKSSLSSGVVIKQHLLERSRYPHPKVNPTTKIARVQGTGSADNTMVDYNVKDLALSGSVSIGSIKGGAGGGPNVYNQIANNPYEQSIGTELPSGIPVTNLTQSFTQSLDTIGGTFETIDSKQEEFYNGEYSGSEYVVEDGELSPGCFVYLHGLPETIPYSASIFNPTASYVTEERFIDEVNTPMLRGYVYFFGEENNISKVRISKYDANLNYIENELTSLISISTISELGGKTYQFAGAPTDLGKDYLYTISNTQGLPTYTGNNIIKTSFGLNIPSGEDYQFTTNFNPINNIVINDGGPYNGLNFFPLDVQTSLVNVFVTDKNSQFPSQSIYDQTNGEIFYHYSNDDLLAVEPGLNGRSVYGTNVSLSGGQCRIMFALMALRGDDEKAIIWDSTPQTLTSTPTTFIQTFATTSFFNTLSPLNASNTDPNQDFLKPKYLLGFVRSNIISTQASSFLEFNDGFDFSISQSQYGLDNKGKIDTILESSFPEGFRNSDCDVLQGNATKDRPGTLYYDVDYASSQYTAINEEAILNGTAPFASVQNSNYTTLGHINPRYKGSRSTSPEINVWAPTTAPDGTTYISQNTFGKLPTVSREKTFFAYCDFFNGTSPELNNKTLAHVQFLVDQDGNTIPPDSSSLYITQNSFQTGETVLINLDDPTRFETPMNELNGGKTVIRGGTRVDALLYSDSGSTYSGEIQFDTGSFSVTNYQFLATNNNGIGEIPENDTTVYTYTTGSSGNPGFNNETQTNSQYNNTNGKFTFTSDSDSPVKFKASIDLEFLYAAGNVFFYIVKNWTSGTPSPDQILDFQSFGGSFGSTTYHTINLDTGFQNFASGDTVQVVYYSTFGSSYTAQLNINNSDSFQAINQINPSGLITEDYWHVTASTDIWMTGSTTLSGNIWCNTKSNLGTIKCKWHR